MVSKLRFLAVEQVERLHLEVLHRFGGSAGVRDRGLLESAVEMPRATYDGKFLHTTIASMAAAYFFHLCRNHPFVDGNKRAALGAALIFLEINSRSMRATDDELERLTLGVASGEIGKDEAMEFFRRRVRTS